VPCFAKAKTICPNGQGTNCKFVPAGGPKVVTRELAKQYDFLKRNDELTEDFIKKLTPEQQQIANAINRRTEFRVLSTDFIEKFDAEPEK
jgi:peptidoglycan-associated lipoprotein